jgi:hypothetical protein
MYIYTQTSIHITEHPHKPHMPTHRIYEHNVLRDCRQSNLLEMHSLERPKTHRDQSVIKRLARVDVSIVQLPS